MIVSKIEIESSPIFIPKGSTKKNIIFFQDNKIYCLENNNSRIIF
jgi:hypothetical protein